MNRLRDRIGTCRECGSEFRYPASHGKGVFCSRKCTGKFHGKQGWKRVRDKLSTYKCEKCEIEFKSYHKDRKYCSRRCHIEVWISEVRYNSRKDKNHSEIVSLLEKYGCSVIDSSCMGRGFPDLLVCIKRVIYFAEIKNPKTSYGRIGGSKSQKVFAKELNGIPVYILRDEKDVGNLALGRLDKVSVIEA